MSGRWRTGRKVGRTIYIQTGDEPSDDDTLIGVMDTPQLAAYVVAAVENAQRRYRLAETLGLVDDPEPECSRCGHGVDEHSAGGCSHVDCGCSLPHGGH